MKTINFMKNKNALMTISFVLVFCSIISFFIKGFDLGIDFKGGVVTEMQFSKSVNAADIKEILIDDFTEVVSLEYGSSRNIVVQTPIENNYKNASSEIYSKIKSVKGYEDTKLVRSEFIGPKVGEELKTNGILSLLIVIIGVLIYVSFRFEFKFAIGAIFALVHDLLIVSGIIVAFQIDLDLTVLAAILALLGYSLNDTIVVYDRVRENFQKFNKLPVNDIINISLSETLSRTIMTSLTTSATLIALLIFGGETLSNFSIVLLLGVCIGTYSSIYVASGVLTFLNINSKQFEKTEIDTENGVV